MAYQKPTHSDAPSDETMGKMGWWVAILCACTLGPTGLELFIKILPEYGGLNEAALIAMWRVFLLSAPMVIAVAISALALFREWFPGTSFIGFLVFVWGIALFVSWLGIGIAPVEFELVWEPTSSGLTNGVIVTISLIWGFFKAYGALLFISAAALGLWLGLATQKLLEEQEDIDTLRRKTH